MADTRAIRVVLYMRLSDLRDEDLDKDGAGKTFVDREQELRDHAAELAEKDGREWKVVKVVVENDVVSRDGKHRPASAFKRRMVTLPDGTRALRTIRPGFRRVLSYLQSGFATALLAEDGDRITRDGRDGEDLLDVVEMKKLNVRTVTGVCNLTDGGTDAEVGAFRDAVNASNKEARKMAGRARRGRKRSARHGVFGGGPRPFGFEPDGVTKRWEECEIIRVASQRVLQVDGRRSPGKKPESLRMLAAELRDAGVPTVTGVAWTSSTLRDILLRARNAGIAMNNEVEHPAVWSPIVPEPVFRAVVRVLTDPSRRTGGVSGTAPKWLGSGMYLCGACGDGTMLISNGRNGTKRYRCSKEDHLSRNQAHVDGYVESVIIERLARPDAIDLFAQPTEEIDTAGLRAESSSIRVRLNALAEDRMLGLIDREQLRTGTAVAQERLAEIDQLLIAAAAESPLAELVASDDVVSAWVASSLSVKRAVLDALCTVTIMPTNRRGRGFDQEAVVILPKRAGGPGPDSAPHATDLDELSDCRTRKSA